MMRDGERERRDGERAGESTVGKQETLENEKRMSGFRIRICLAITVM
jgi:hypothetical protein